MLTRDIDIAILSIGPSVVPHVRRLCQNELKQEAQLSQRDRATPCVIDYFAKSLKVTQGRSK